MPGARYTISAEVWHHPGAGGWHFVTLPAEVADDIGARTRASRVAFGSVRVRARIGTHSWETSVFADRKRASYLLPVKAAARRALGLAAGARVDIVLELISAPARPPKP